MKYGRPTPLIEDKHNMIFTESELSLDSKWSTVNVSLSSFLKLQLSRLFVTRSLVFLHFGMASESTGTAGSLSKMEKKYKFKYKFFIWGNVHRRWREDQERAWFKGQHFSFSPHLTRAMRYCSWCCLQIILKSKINHLTCYLSVIFHTLSAKYHQLKN